MIPSVNREEWSGLIIGNEKFDLSNFTLKMKITSLNMGYRTGLMSLTEAVENLHAMCEKHENLFKEDIQKIFNV